MGWRIPEGITTGLAPRFADGWAAVDAILADDEWHSYVELEHAIVATGLAERSAQNLLRDLRLDGWVHATKHKGRNRRFRRLPVIPIDPKILEHF